MNKDNILINNKTLDSFVKDHNRIFARISRFVMNNKITNYLMNNKITNYLMNNKITNYLMNNKITNYLMNKLSSSNLKEISIINEEKHNTLNDKTNLNKQQNHVKAKRRPLGFGDDEKIREPLNKNVERTLQRMSRSSSKNLDKS